MRKAQWTRSVRCAYDEVWIKIEKPAKMLKINHLPWEEITTTNRNESQLFRIEIYNNNERKRKEETIYRFFPSLSHSALAVCAVMCYYRFQFRKWKLYLFSNWWQKHVSEQHTDFLLWCISFHWPHCTHSYIYTFFFFQWHGTVAVCNERQL